LSVDAVVLEVLMAGHPKTVFESAAVFGQSTSDNSAVDALKKRILSMNLFVYPQAPKPFMLAGPMTTPKICAIPLLRVVPPGATYKMPVVKPMVNPRELTVQVPAPACDEALFTNK
jgi:hypothetical protein